MSKMVIIENRKQFEELKEAIKDKTAFAFPILASHRKHPVENQLACIFIQIRGNDNIYVYPGKHNDCLMIPLKWIAELNPNTFIVPDKKLFMQLVSVIPDTAIIDYYGMEHIRMGELSNFDAYKPQAMLDMEYAFTNYKGVGSAVPIMMLYLYAINVLSDMMEFVEKFGLDYNVALNNINIPVLSTIEAAGLYVNQELYTNHFGEKAAKYIDKNGLVYTSYNPYTITGRPSNRWGGVNFAAINKSDGSRKCFESRFGQDGKLVLIDYEAFHIRLIANLIDFQLPDGSIHEYFGRQYFDKTLLTEEEYAESKRITFENLYNEERKLSHIPFFAEIYKYIDGLWEEANKNGYVMFGSKRIMRFDLAKIKNPRPAKLFNYIIQNLETNTALAAAVGMNNVLKDSKSKIVLYTYDSFLIDLHKSDSHLLNKVITEMNYGGAYPVRVYYGSNYDEMKQLEISVS